MSNEMPIEGFSPIAKACSRVLILGSMPSVMSLNLQQYYGHSRNAFWPIMMQLFNGSADADYNQRKQILLDNRIAVWDVLKSCRRTGSLDSRIENDSLIINNFAAFFARHERIEYIFFNGAVAEKLYRKYVLGSLKENLAALPCSRLPSTSPAHAAMSFQEKAQHWRVITEAVSLD
jgi:double-stranded uracil-DNA glycosylase